MVCLGKLRRISNDNYFVVDRLNASVLFMREKNFTREFNPPKRKVWYNRKRPRGAKVVKTMINFMFNEKQETESLYFITITTCQHKTGMLDTELFSRIGLWFKNRKQSDYVITVERQRETQDLHFHCVVLFNQGERYSFGRELQYLGRLFKVEPHSALLDVKRITNVERVVGYIRKYITKDNGKYCSLFGCRTFSVSKRLRRRYKENAGRYVKKLRGDAAVNFVREIREGRVIHGKEGFVRLEKERNSSDWFTMFKYNRDIWDTAVKYEEAENRLE